MAPWFCSNTMARGPQRCRTSRGAGPPEARGPMQLHRLHRLKAGLGHSLEPLAYRIISKYGHTVNLKKLTHWIVWSDHKRSRAHGDATHKIASSKLKIGDYSCKIFRYLGIYLFDAKSIKLEQRLSNLGKIQTFGSIEAVSQSWWSHRNHWAITWYGRAPIIEHLTYLKIRWPNSAQSTISKKGVASHFQFFGRQKVDNYWKVLTIANNY